MADMRWASKLQHYHYDRFDLVDDEGEKIFKPTFITDVNGNISGYTVLFDGLEKPTLFKRKGID